MEKLILSNNAVALYKLSRFDEFQSLNLDRKEKAIDTLDFIKNNIGVELYNNDDCEDTSDYYRVSRYQNKRIYEIPKVCFILENEDEDENEKEEKVEKEDQKKYFDFLNKKNLTIYFLILIIMFGFISNFFVGQKVKTNLNESVEIQQNEYNEFDKIFIEIAKLDLEKKDQLIIQQEARKIVDKSIKKVKEIEKKQEQLRITSLNLSNKVD